MKKILTIGAISAGIVALPMVGAFAACDPLTDTINLTVTETCNFTRTTGNGTYSATMQVNKLNSSVGTSTFKAVCNSSSGFSVSAVPTSISGTGAAITYSANTPSAGGGTWTAYNSTANANIAATSGTLMTSSGPTDGDGLSATVVYKVSTRNNQAKGAYSGTITYTLSQSS